MHNILSKISSSSSEINRNEVQLGKETVLGKSTIQQYIIFSNDEQKMAGHTNVC